jgi:release factor glutamine methyltransferase
VATVQEVLQPAIERLRIAGCETPRLDAELLLSHAIGADRTEIIMNPTALVGDGSAARFDEEVSRREAGEPVAYIRGFKEFYGLAFASDPRALIPRPETEKLVELAEALVLSRLAAAPRPHGAPPLRIADIGTGGGTIAVSLAVALRRRGALEDVEIIGTDESGDALALARENAVGHGVADRVRFIDADLLPPVVAVPYEIVVANLPYVSSDAIDGLPIAASFEPRTALDGGPGGLAVIRRLVARLPEALTDDGVALLEIGSDQGERIVPLVAEALPGWECTVELDLSGHPRVARIARHSA